MGIVDFQHQRGNVLCRVTDICRFHQDNLDCPAELKPKVFD